MNNDRVQKIELPRTLSVTVGLAATVIAIAGLKAGSGIIAPIITALVVLITLNPVRRWLDRHGLPGWASALITVLVAYALLVLVTLSLILAVGRLAGLTPRYTAEFNDLIAQAGQALEARGVRAEDVGQLVSSLDIGKVLSAATNFLSGTLGVLSNVALIAGLVLFLALDAGPFRRHFQAARIQRPALVDALENFTEHTRRYFAVSTVFGLIVAVLDVGALVLLGIPGAFVWGVLAFVTNFIPNIGFVIGVVPPAVIALLDGGLNQAIIVVVIYSVINIVIQSVIQPTFVGDAVGLSPTVTFVSLLFWAWVFGPLGAVLAIPLTLLARAVLLDADPASRWVIPLISGRDDADSEPAHRT